MSSCKISVIVPVFNVECYLSRCVMSLINQTYKNIEIILVDDGSSDTTPELCEEFVRMDSRVKTLHKKNGGLSSARNAGLSFVTGDFVTFVDSDDWLALDTFEYCLGLIDKYGADAVEYEYLYVSGENDVVTCRKEKVNVYQGKDILQFFMLSTTKRGNYSVCVCLFKRNVLEDLSFRDGKIAEDGDFKYKAYQKCKTLVASNQRKYFYFQSGSSISTGGLKKKDFDLYDAVEELSLLSEAEIYGDIRRLGRVKKARTSLSFLCKIAYFGISDNKLDKEEIVKKLVIDNRSNLWTLLFSPIPFNRKLLSIMFAISYPMTESCIYLAKKYFKRI